MDNSKSSELKRGVIIFIGLAILTLVEYVMAVSQLPAILLWIIAFGKAAMVVWFFMHIFRLFRSEGGH